MHPVLKFFIYQILTSIRIIWKEATLIVQNLYVADSQMVQQQLKNRQLESKLSSFIIYMPVMWVNNYIMLWKIRP